MARSGRQRERERERDVGRESLTANGRYQYYVQCCKTKMIQIIVTEEIIVSLSHPINLILFVFPS